MSAHFEKDIASGKSNLPDTFYHEDFPLLCHLFYAKNDALNDRIILILVTLCSVSFPVIAALFGLVAGCMLNKKHKK